MYSNNGYYRNDDLVTQGPSYTNPYIRENQNAYNGYGYNSQNYEISVNTLQMRNTMLKGQYPDIYLKINDIISDIIPKYRNASFTEDVVNKMVDEIYDTYIGENNTRSLNEKKEKIKDTSDTETRNVNHTVDLKDLIKIILITRLIKFNLDNMNNYQQPYNMYGYRQTSPVSQNMYMGYTPRNYF